MKSSPVIITITLDTSARVRELGLQRFYWAAICDTLTRRGHYAEILSLSVRRKETAGTPEGGAE